MKKYNVFQIANGFMCFKGLLFFIVAISSCSDFLQVEIPKSKTAQKLVFQDPVTATSAITGMYVEMLQESSFASGSLTSITALCGLSADELQNYSQIPDFLNFEENALLPTNQFVSSLYNSFYRAIYNANINIEGINDSEALTQLTRKQLLGECYFIRAFSYFYLINTFGDVPLALSADYEVNARLPRASKLSIQNQIISDLQLAEELLSDEYLAVERIRPNKSVAKAMLARVYLYQKEWRKAFDKSTEVISNEYYQLEENLNQVFLVTSREAIWQLGNPRPNFNTYEGQYFIIEGFAQFNILRSSFLMEFDSADERRFSWVGEFSDGVDTLYFPHKYKQRNTINVAQGEQITEYSMVFRLAEQYLIRAEALAEMGELTSAIDDLDRVRLRAGLPSLSEIKPGIQQVDLLDAIIDERRKEFFTEWGHRWFDLVRTDRVDVALGSIKNNWKPTAILFPIPQMEFARNPNLILQNSGY